MAVGSTLVVGGLSSRVAAPKDPTGQGSVETLPDPAHAPEPIKKGCG